jgi:mRNA-degrading endonuclease RelE of RelBE toxin-antitoxin system
MNQRQDGHANLLGKQSHWIEALIVSTIAGMTREAVFKPQALEHLRRLSVYHQRAVTDGIRRHLVESNPRAETRNKFRLRRASEAADYELGSGDLRVLYRIEGSVVFVTAVGIKRENTLVVRGEEFPL